MVTLRPVIDLLTPKPAWFKGNWFRQVEGAAEYARRALTQLPLPGCWVVRQADPADQKGERCALLKVNFDLIIGITNERMARAGDTDDVLLAYRHACKRLLMGVELVPDTPPVQFHGGQVVEYTEGDLFWRDRYSFDALITNYLDDPEPPFTALVMTKGNEQDDYL